MCVSIYTYIHFLFFELNSKRNNQTVESWLQERERKWKREPPIIYYKHSTLWCFQITYLCYFNTKNIKLKQKIPQTTQMEVHEYVYNLIWVHPRNVPPCARHDRDLIDPLGTWTWTVTGTTVRGGDRRETQRPEKPKCFHSVGGR